VCLAGQACYLGGIGDALAPAPALPSAHMVLVNPGVALSTAAVFAARGGDFGVAARFEDAPADAAALAVVLAARGNDLDDAATRLAPVIGEVRAALAARPGCLLARMSGSGATCFGLFADAAPAEAAAGVLMAEHAGWWVAATPLAVRTASVVAPAPA
jgi:4-diphosphocytidyl-2-C-methyl-D-erythritol kinase